MTEEEKQILREKIEARKQREAAGKLTVKKKTAKSKIYAGVIFGVVLALVLGIIIGVYVPKKKTASEESESLMYVKERLSEYEGVTAAETVSAEYRILHVTYSDVALDYATEIASTLGEMIGAKKADYDYVLFSLYSNDCLMCTSLYDCNIEHNFQETYHFWFDENGEMVQDSAVKSQQSLSQKEADLKEKETELKTKEDDLKKQEDDIKKREDAVKKKEEIGAKESQQQSQKPEQTQQSSVSVEYSNALEKAKSYLDFTSFSYEGLFDQLKYNQFSDDAARYAVDNCGADWNEQAAKKAQSYMEFTSFSRGDLIDQLVFDGFTQEQAEYGASAVGY